MTVSESESASNSRKVYVEVLGEKGILLLSTHPGDKDMKPLPPGSYVFYTHPVTDMEGKTSEWALFANDPQYGIPLDRLENLDKIPKGVLQATDYNGGRFFK